MRSPPACICTSTERLVNCTRIRNVERSESSPQDQRGRFSVPIKEGNQEQQQLKVNEQKWTKPLMDAGWTVIPSVILDRQQALGLDAVDVNILLHLAKHWWEKERLPYPTKRAIAECMGVSESTIQRRIAQMEKDGLVRRVPRFSGKHKGQKSNAYDIAGLIEGATQFAKEVLRDRNEKRKADEARRNRKRPRLASSSE